ncbi:MAG: MASE3 domain-containing protein [Methylococcaceae bacterium]
MISSAYLKKWIFLIFVCSLFPFLLTLLFHAQLYTVMNISSYLIFHNIAEFFSVVVSFSIFGVGWYAYEQTNNRHILFLSTSFFVIGWLDFFHALGYFGMPDFVTPNNPAKSSQYWIAARLFMGLTFLGSAFIYPNTKRFWLSKIVLMTGCFVFPALAFIGITFFPEQMPVTIIEGVGLTPFKKNTEYLIIILLFISLVIYWQRILKTNERHLIYFLSAFVVCIFGEAAFTGYKSVFDTYNVLGHIYKIVAFHLIYLGLFAVSVKNPYLELATTNKQLQEEIAERIKIEQALKNYQDGLEDLVAKRTSELEKAKIVAEFANNSKSVFLSNMSHELRTPMNAILGLVFILKKSNLSEEDKLLLNKIHVAGQSLLGIINNVLDMSKIEAGKFELEISVFNLHDILDNLATIMTFSASERNIDLIIHPPIAVPVNRLKGDSLRLQQVLVNLIGNAIKFTHHGYVHVSISVLECNENNVYLHFSVSDTGTGIAKNVQETIFTSFSQADNSITRRYGGTGLGLAISRQLVSLMGGEISLTSDIGKGSDFSFNLHFDYVDSDDTTYPDSKALDILIVDDNEIARNALLSITQILGWSAIAVDSGKAALDYVSTYKNNDIKQEVIVLDWQMPQMDGLLTAKAIHKKMKFSKQKPIVIMVTSYDKRFLDEHPEATIFDAVLSKPVTASSLYDAISRAMRANQQDEPQKHISNSTQFKRLDGCRLLIVDDNEINLEVANRIFTAEGAFVTTIDNGQQAVEWLKNNVNAIDLVLMDIQMPIMDGYDATRLIRQIPSLVNLPVVALSAGVFKSQIELAKSAGINDFIAKPFDVNAAVNLIAKLTKQSLTIQTAQTRLSFDMPSNILTEPFSGIDIKAALKIWKDVEIYKRYLIKFSTECELLLNAITNENIEEFSRLIHKTKGAAKMLGLIELGNIAYEIDELLNDNQDITQAVERLKNIIITAKTLIYEYTTMSEQHLESEIKAFDGVIVTNLLKRVLHSVEKDSPDGLATTIDELSTYLTDKHIESLKLALDFFDFPLAKSEVIKLADEFNLSLGV